jgi:hypothetical protein
LSRPLNFIGSQALHFFTPLISVVTDAEGYRAFCAFLEQRGSIDYFCQRIEFWVESKDRPDGDEEL